MPIARRGSEFRMELSGDEPRMVRQLHDFHQAVAREPGKFEPALAEAFQIGVVEFEAMAVTLEDEVLAVDLARHRASAEHDLLRAETHAAAFGCSLIALL